MSAIVDFIAIRKSDNVPYFDIYLGGNGVKGYLKSMYETVVEIEDGFVIPNVTKDMLLDLQDEMYDGRCLDECLEFVEKNGNAFSYFFIIVQEVMQVYNGLTIQNIKKEQCLCEM